MDERLIAVQVRAGFLDAIGLFLEDLPLRSWIEY